MADWPAPHIVYRRAYNIGFPGVGHLHPFDARKYGRAWRAVGKRCGWRAGRVRVAPRRPVSRDALLAVHTAAYLDSLADPAVLAKALEVAVLARLPAWVTDRLVLRPMRWATAGTVRAAELAVVHGLAVNLSGGYHHARPDRGHGFCLYADAAVAIAHLRRTGQLSADDRVLHVDLDAHQGDGVCHCFAADRRAFLYDQYNRANFPDDAVARRRLDCDVPVPVGTLGREYLATLRGRLPPFLDGVGRVGLAVYNAGTDILSGDPLGRLRLSADDVLARDAFVLEALIARRIPTVMVLSGGYTAHSYRLVAATVGHVLERWGGLTPRRPT